MKILKYPSSVIECSCGCVFAFNADDVHAKEVGTMKDSYYVFSVKCPVCEEESTLDSSNATRPYPVENEGLDDVCHRVFDSLRPKTIRVR